MSKELMKLCVKLGLNRSTSELLDELGGANTWSDRELKIYEIGHREGESCNEVDWLFALEEAFDLEVEGIQEAIDQLLALLEATCLESYKKGYIDGQLATSKEV